MINPLFDVIESNSIEQLPRDFRKGEQFMIHNLVFKVFGIPVY